MRIVNDFGAAADKLIGIKDMLEQLSSKLPEEFNLTDDNRLLNILKTILVIGESRSRDLKEMEVLRNTDESNRAGELADRFQNAFNFLKPIMPIESLIINEGIELGAEDARRIEQCISWEDMRPDGYRGGRKIVIKLKKPILTADGRRLTAVEIKGVVYKDGEKKSPPLARVYRRFFANRIDDNDQLKSVAVFQLKGALAFKDAERENMIMENLRGYGFDDIEYPIGYGEYKNFTYHNKKFGFVITGVERINEKRMWDVMVEENPGILKEFKDPAAVKDFFKRYEHWLREYGKQLRRFNDKGYFHGCAHLLNAGLDESAQRVKLHDFQTSKIIRGLSSDRKVAYRLLDLYSAYIHFLGFVFDSAEGGSKEYTLASFLEFSRKLKGVGDPFLYFLAGYFHREADVSGLEMLPEDILWAVAENRMVSIDFVENRVVNILYGVEEKSKSLDKRRKSLRGNGSVDIFNRNAESVSEILFEQAI